MKVYKITPYPPPVLYNKSKEHYSPSVGMGYEKKKKKETLPSVCVYVSVSVMGCAIKQPRHGFVWELREDKSLEKHNFLSKVREL